MLYRLKVDGVFRRQGATLSCLFFCLVVLLTDTTMAFAQTARSSRFLVSTAPVIDNTVLLPPPAPEPQPIQKAEANPLLVDRQSDAVLRKIVLQMLEEMKRTNGRLDSLEGRMGNVEEDIAKLDKQIESLAKEVLGAPSQTTSVRTQLASNQAQSNASVAKSNGSGDRVVLAKFSPNQPSQLPIRAANLLLIDGAMFVERTNASVVPMVTASQVCPHCVRCGSINVGGTQYGIHYQGCQNRFVMVANR